MTDQTTCEAGGCIHADRFDTADGPIIRTHSTQTGTTMQATVSETARYFDEIKAGKWDHLLDGADVAADVFAEDLDGDLAQL